MPTHTELLTTFAEADCCWYASVRGDGRAHLAPIWHVWLEGAAYVVTQPDSVRARNLVHNPSVSLSLPDPLNVFIIEGRAELAPEMEATLRPLFQAKYNWDISTDAAYTAIIRIVPHKFLAWGDGPDGRWQERWRPD